MPKKPIKHKPVKAFREGDDPFRALIPNMVDQPRESALWSLRIRNVRDLEKIRVLLLKDIETDKLVRVASAGVYAKIVERQSRMLGLDEPVKQEFSVTNYDSIISAFRRGEREGQTANTDQINAKKEP
jgi:hypothetical protein